MQKKQQILITAQEVALVLNCSRTAVDRLQLKGEIVPVSTIHPKYYFDKDKILEFKGLLNSKNAKS